MTTRNADGDRFSLVVVELLRVGGLLEAEGDRLAQVAGQTAARARVLAALEDEARTVAQVARRLTQKRQSVQRVADLLEGEKLLRYVANPDDQRAQKLELTATGRKALQKIQAEQARWAERLGGELGASRLQALHGALERVTELLTPKTDK